MKMLGRVDFTLYPTVWESRQKPLLKEILELQDELIVNMIFEKVPDLLNQIETLIAFFEEQERNLDRFCLCLGPIARSLKIFYGKPGMR